MKVCDRLGAPGPCRSMFTNPRTRTIATARTATRTTASEKLCMRHDVRENERRLYIEAGAGLAKRARLLRRGLAFPSATQIAKMSRKGQDSSSSGLSLRPFKCFFDHHDLLDNRQTRYPLERWGYL